MDDGPGGSLRTITSYVLTIGGVKLSSKMEEVTAFGDSFAKFLPSGLASSGGLITIEGLWDTTATTGPHATLSAPDDGPQDATRSLALSPGDSKTYNVEGYLVSYEVIGTVGALTRFRAEFQPTSTVAFA